MTKRDAYLIIHGFAGNTTEITHLVEHMREAGRDVHTVLLAGHGGTKRDLAAVSYQDWTNSAFKMVETLSQTYEHIHLIGFSMGGLISIQLASLPKVGKIVLVNTPIYFWNMRIILFDIVDGLYKRQFEKILYYYKSAKGVAIKSGLDFLRILSVSKKMLDTVQNSTLIMQCKRDEVVRPKSAAYLKRRIGGAQMRLYNGGRHMIFVADDDLRETVCRDIMRFLL